MLVALLPIVSFFVVVFASAVTVVDKVIVLAKEKLLNTLRFYSITPPNYYVYFLSLSYYAIN